MSEINNNGRILANYARHRMMKKNKNVQQTFVGETGSGKTYSAGSFTGLVDPSFFDDMERIVFNAKDFMHEFQSMRKGEGLVFEEAGVELAARNFQSKINKAIGYVNQTFRHRNLCVTYTVPSMKFVELQVRDLLHAIVSMQWIDDDAEVAYGDVWKIKHDPVDGVSRRGYYEYISKGGQRGVIDRAGFSLPPQKWIAEYEKMKLDYTTELYQKIERELTEEGKTKDVKVLERQANVLLNILPEVKKHHPWAEIEDWSQVSARTMQRWLESASLAEV